MTGQSDAPRPHNPGDAREASTQSVTRPTDNLRSRLAWNDNLVGLRPSTVVVGLALSQAANVREPFPIDNDQVAERTGYALSTVLQAIADLIRHGRLERVRRALPDAWQIKRWTIYGAYGRWVPRPALYRLTMGSHARIGR